MLIRADKGKVNPAYLTYYLLAPKQQHDLKSSANGTTVDHINMPRIRGLKVDLPVLNIQGKIAEILSAYDNLIDNYHRQIQLLEEAAQRLYKEWFVNLHFPGYEHTKIVLKDGTCLFADRLVWSGSQNPVKARGNVVIIRNEEFYATANEIEISPDYSKFKIIGHAVSKIYDTKENK